MPNDFNASKMQILQVEMASVWKNKGTVNPELTNTPIALPYIIGNQTANAMPILEGSGKYCVGTEVWYPTADNTALPSTTLTPTASSCDLTTGDGLSTAKQAYALNVFQKYNIKINDKDCDNLMKFIQKSAFLIANKMHLSVRSLNERMISDLDANKSVASNTNLPSAVTVNGALNYEIADSTYWEGIEAAKIIPVLDQLAFEKGIAGNYYIVAGKALSIPSLYAKDRSANDNERSYEITFSSRKMVNDIKNLDPIINAEVIYLVDPNCVVSYFHSEYPVEGEDTGDKNNTVNFSLPVIYYTNYQDGSSNQQPLTYMNDGVSVPVMMDFRYQKACNPTINSNGYVSHDHVWEMMLTGTIDFVPKVGDNTGILRVDKG